MRRLLITLLSALVLAALVPAATLAARPTYDITSIDVTAAGTVMSGSTVVGCSINITVTYEPSGRVKTIQQGQGNHDDYGYNAWLYLPSERDGSVVFNRISDLWAHDDWIWSAMLVSGRNVGLGSSQSTAAYTYTGADQTCPMPGTTLAHYPTT